VSVSVLLAFGFGGWSLYAHLTEPDMMYLVLGLSSFVVGIGLVVYGIKVMRKLRHI